MNENRALPDPIPMFIVVEIETSGNMDTGKALEALERLVLEAEIPFERTKGHLFIRESADRIRDCISQILEDQSDSPISMT